MPVFSSRRSPVAPASKHERLFPTVPPRAGIIRRGSMVFARDGVRGGAVVIGLLVFFLLTDALRADAAPQRHVMAHYLVGDPSQKRPRGEMAVDPILMQVAQARAEDFVKRRYFSHVNPDGYGPNHLVRAAGYDLPEFWGTGRSGNYVESIGAGYASAAEVWRMWMGSSGHRTHLLALKSFYRPQTNYGIGYCSAPGSPYGCYWVIITAPPSSRKIAAVAAGPESEFGPPEVARASGSETEIAIRIGAIIGWEPGMGARSGAPQPDAAGD